VDDTDPCDGVICPEGETCNPKAGGCISKDQLMPCISVIDEWNTIQYTMNDSWTKF
jgi:hypothetical protein